VWTGAFCFLDGAVFMDKSKQNVFLIVIAIILILILIPQVVHLWQILQLPLDQLFALPALWNEVGLLLLIPSLLVATTISLPQLKIEDRDVYQKPLLTNFIASGVFQLFAAWRDYQLGGTQVGFYLLLAVFSFAAPALIKQIRSRLDT
jgi:hypothetical protein